MAKKKKEKVRAAVRLGLQTQIDRHHKSIKCAAVDADAAAGRHGAPFHSNSHHRKIKKKKKLVCIQWDPGFCCCCLTTVDTVNNYLATVLAQSMR